MFMTVEPPQAWGLLRGMARAVGVDLVAAVAEGWMARADLGALIETCACCDQAQVCTLWLATNIRAETPPPFCHNRRGIAELLP